MRFDFITIFPHIFDSYFGESILKRAAEKRLVTFAAHDLRKWTSDKHRTVDDKPYGGGAGMVLMAAPILKAVDAVRGKMKGKRSKVIVFSAKGGQFNQKMAHEWAKRYDRLILIAGRYEGIDERVVTVLKAEEVSIGPYVLTDGDVAAMVVASAVTRLLPGAITLASLKEESHWSLLTKDETGGRGLEYPHYTRPEVLTYKGKKHRVPKVLLSGDHKKIAAWRKQKSGG
ncbi:tRNA (guanosine(37)-N1)-methyltransferase TrmD [Candidatus Uhrbacteria bacterium]|nr:tRNA (guanosine(37)-N1)-methyltransferase TrmD [Candidatus Uhrbacteria bacterium]